MGKEGAYDTLVFDFFGVVCSEIAPFWLLRYLPEDKAKKVKTEIVEIADTGEITQGEMLSRLGALVGITSSQVEQEWWSYVTIDQNMVDLIEKARDNFKVGLLTNAPSPFINRILKENNLSRLFDSIVISSEHGYAKPNSKIFQIMLSTLAAKAESSVFIDDNPRNIEGAAAAGMYGIIYSTPENLSEALRKLG